jgi:hypothetical protein
MQRRVDELEEMKRIDLCQYAASRGFVFDRRNSSRCSAVMRHSNGDKLIVGRSKSGQYIYFNAKGNDNGTIIDFVQTRDRVSIGEVRKLLRPWLGKNASPLRDLPALPFQLQPSEHDAARVLTNWIKAKPIGKTHEYLETMRCISREVLSHPAFEDRIRRDDRRNALFPHFNQSGLCGFEVKNHRWTGFSPGGIKGLGCSRPRPSDRRMILCETFIDLLSYATLKGIEGNRFFSTAGQISPAQGECLRSAVQNMPANSEVVFAFDNDDGGHKLAELVKAEIAATGARIVFDLPPRPGDDWNDVLKREHTSASFITSSPQMK